MRLEDLWALYNVKHNKILSVHTTKVFANAEKFKLIHDGSITFYDAFVYRLPTAIDRIEAAAELASGNKFAFGMCE